MTAYFIKLHGNKKIGHCAGEASQISLINTPPKLLSY
jgi:hypothetical protein